MSERGSGPSNIGALEQAAQELLRAGDEASKKGQAAQSAGEESSADTGTDERDATLGETIAPRGGRSSAHLGIRRVLAALRSVSTRTLVIAGILLALLVYLAVSSMASHKGSHQDVATQSCVAGASGVDATVVVTNHGDGAASYTFDVVFSQNQSAVERVPAQVPALSSGMSQTFHTHSGSLDSSKPFTCTLANVRRLAA